MGIPFLFYHIVKKNADVVVDSITGPCDRLFLDFNSIIHMCSASVVSNSRDRETSWNAIFAKIIDHTLNQIVLRCKPRELLYIAIDGVAPLAKIQQQRKRRYMTAYRNALINEFKQNHGIPISEWDSNVITPGTAFMTALDSFLSSYFTIERQEELGFKVIISGSTEEGEGEHKMIRYIKESSGSDMCRTDVIYGLDADLIMLSLTCDLDNNLLYLMRESSTFEDITNGTTFFKFLDIRGLKRCVGNELCGDGVCDAYMRDYVALSYFLGNDFLPNISFLKIKSGGIELIKQLYKEVQSDMGESDQFLVIWDHAYKSYKLNDDFLTRLLEKLYNIEDVEMTRIYNEWVSIKPMSYRGPGHNILDKFITGLENYPHIHKNVILRRFNSLSTKWRDHYYHELFGINSNSNNMKIAVDYIKGLSWITDYYFNKKSSNRWVYSYNYAPTAMDLYLARFASYDKCETDELAVSPQLQMALVLPPASLNKIVPGYAYNDYNIAYLYPKRFVIDVYLKNYLWESIPRLPPITTSAIKKIEHHLKTI